MSVLFVLFSNMLVVIGIVVTTISLLQKIKTANEKAPRRHIEKSQKNRRTETVDYNQTLRSLWHNPEESVNEEAKQFGTTRESMRQLNQKKATQGKSDWKSTAPIPEEQFIQDPKPIRRTIEEFSVDNSKIAVEDKIENPKIVPIERSGSMPKKKHIKRSGLQKAIVYQEVIGKPKAYR